MDKLRLLVDELLFCGLIFQVDKALTSAAAVVVAAAAAGSIGLKCVHGNLGLVVLILVIQMVLVSVQPVPLLDACSDAHGRQVELADVVDLLVQEAGKVDKQKDDIESREEDGAQRQQSQRDDGRQGSHPFSRRTQSRHVAQGKGREKRSVEKRKEREK